MALYTYGKFLEPPKGTVLHGLGHTQNQNVALYNAYGGVSIPSIESYNFNVGTYHATPLTRAIVLARLNEIAARGATPNIGISMKDFETGPSFNTPLDDLLVDDPDALVPGGTVSYNEIITEIAAGIVAFNQPCFIRIGWEFNNAVGYHSHDYVTAYIYIKRAFEAAGVSRAAYAWVWEPSGTTDYFTKDAGVPRWYPGDEHVDWYGIDIFSYAGYLSPTATFHGKISSFLKAAHSRRFPVMVPECDPVASYGAAGIESGGVGADYWEGWFEPFFKLLEDYPVIKAFNYVTFEGAFPDIELGIQVNADLLALWRAKLAEAKFIPTERRSVINYERSVHRPAPYAWSGNPALNRFLRV